MKTSISLPEKQLYKIIAQINNLVERESSRFWYNQLLDCSQNAKDWEIVIEEPKIVPSATLIVSELVNIIDGSCNRLIIVFLYSSTEPIYPVLPKLWIKEEKSISSKDFNLNTTGYNSWIFARGTILGFLTNPEHFSPYRIVNQTIMAH